MEQVDRQSQFRVKFYRNQYPFENQLVMGFVVTSQQNGCYVELPQYESKKGMIPLNQYSKSMRKAAHRAMKSGKEEILRVIRVDKEKCYIDLSKKDVNQMDQTIGQQKFAKSKTVNSIVRHISEATKIPMKDIYQQFVWSLYQREGNYHPLDLLKQVLIHKQKIHQLGIKTPQIKQKLLHQLQRRFKQSLLKTIAVFQISVRSFDGIKKIKQILKFGVQASKEKNFEVKIFIIGAPVYMIQVTTATKEEGKQAIQIALSAIKQATLLEKGSFEVKKQAKVIGDTNAVISDLQKQQEQALQVNSDQYDQQV